MIQALQPGDPGEVGGYRVIARLGSGGMGEVFLGRSASGRLVAVKVVRAELSTDPDFRARFRREVDASRRVSAFHTAAVVAADADATPAWMVTEYIPSPSLDQAVRQYGAFPLHALRILGAGLAEALEAIHSCDLIHRDLKPSNILLAEDGPRVIDFGIARALEGATVTRTGMTVGSVGFLSPEQLLGERVTPASDVFALGAVLCAAAGIAPFGEGSAQALLYRVVHTPPDITGLPDEIRGIVATCLAKDPGERPRPMDLVHMLSPGPARDWLPPGVLASIQERRDVAQQLAWQERVAGPGSVETTSGWSAASPPTSPPTSPPAPTTEPRPYDSVPDTFDSRAPHQATPHPAAPPAQDPGDASSFGSVPQPPTTPPPAAPPPGNWQPAYPPPSRPAPAAPPFGAPFPAPASSPPYSTPPPYSAPGHPGTPSGGTRLDRLPGGRRAWLPVIVVVAMALLAGIGFAANQLAGDPGKKRKTGSTGGTSPTGGSTGAPGVKGGKVTVSISRDAESLDPAKVTYYAFGEGQRMSALYDPLVVLDRAKGAVAPHLAKGLTTTDGTTWTLELRSDVKFTDGTPLDAAAVKFNWERNADPAVRSPHENAVHNASFTVLDPLRLEIRLPRPDLTYDHVVAAELAFVGSPKAIAENPGSFGTKPVGAGPFMLKTWVREQEQVFERNPNYWQGQDKPRLDSLVFKVASAAPVTPVITGAADLNFQDGLVEIQQAKAAGLAMSPTVSAGGIMLAFNSGAAPFDDVRARQAVTWALDQEVLATAAGGGVRTTRSIVPPGTPYSADAPRQPGPDPAKAQQLFNELAAEGKPLSFGIVCFTRQLDHVEALVAQLRTFKNVDVKVEVKEAEAYSAALDARGYQAIWGFETGYDLDVWLSALTGSNSPYNYLQFRNTTVDGLWETIRGAGTPAAKAAAYRTLLQTLADSAPWWLFGEYAVYAITRKDTLVGLDGAYADGLLRWDRVGLAKS